MEFSNNEFYRKIAKAPFPTPEEQMDMFQRYWAGDKKARNEIWEKNLRMVLSVANNYTPYLELDDAFSIGSIGLQKAIDGYDGKRPFSTYAIDCIGKIIKNELTQQFFVYFPRHAYWELVKIQGIMREYNTEDAEEIAKHCDFSVEKIRRFLPYAINGVANTISLGNPVYEGDEELVLESTLYEETDFDSGFRKEAIASVLAELPPKEAKVLALYFGLDGGSGMTLDEVGKSGEVGADGTVLTRERIRQIKAKAIKRIAENPKFRRKLEAFM